MTVSEQLQSWPDYCHWQTWGCSLGATRWKSRAMNRLRPGIFHRRIFYLPFVLNSKNRSPFTGRLLISIRTRSFWPAERAETLGRTRHGNDNSQCVSVCVDVQSSRDEHGLHHPNPDKELFFRRRSDTWSVTWVSFRPLSRAPRPSPATSAVHKAARASWLIRGFFPESHRCFLCRPHPRPLSPGYLMRRTKSI